MCYIAAVATAAARRSLSLRVCGLCVALVCSASSASLRCTLRCWHVFGAPLRTPPPSLSRMPRNILSLAAGLTAVLLHGVDGHGSMVEPRSRNSVDWLEIKNVRNRPPFPFVIPTVKVCSVTILKAASLTPSLLHLFARGGPVGRYNAESAKGDPQHFPGVRAKFHRGLPGPTPI